MRRKKKSSGEAALTSTEYKGEIFLRRRHLKGYFHDEMSKSYRAEGEMAHRISYINASGE